MANKKGAAVGVAVVALGAGGVAVVRSGDDAARVAPGIARSGDELGRYGDDASRFGDDLPPPETPPPRPVQPAAATELENAAAEDDLTKDVVCAAVGFHELTAEPYSTYEDFAEWAGELVNQVPYERAVNLYESAKALWEEGDLSEVDDIACA